MSKLSETQFTEKLSRLRSLLFNFDKVYETEKINLLIELASYNYTKANVFKHFHQLLLSMMAYSGSQNLLDETEKTMSSLLLQLGEKNSLQQKLFGTGFLYTTIECNFSFIKTQSLIQQHSQKIFIHSCSSSLETQKTILKLLLPTIEYSRIHEGEIDFKKRIAKFNDSKTTTDLEWLMRLIEQSGYDKKAQELVYNQLGIYIQWTVSDKSNSIGFLRGTSLPTYFHTKSIEKKINLQDIIKQKLPSPIKLNLKEREQLIHSAKLTLAYLYRETEPFTNANVDDVTLFQLEKGISIALFGSTVEKRYSLESYIGYLVLKNNIPVSYGGGWIFGERSQFGINILEAFRGGESSLIICELLRVYHQYLGVTRFVVKPYQFGLHNAEAIKTGAFWFYYKLGFRPENETLKKLALEEENQKLVNTTYKSNASTLRKYTKSNLVLTLTESSYPNIDSEILSQHITKHINSFFNGDRHKAMEICYKTLKSTTEIDTKTWTKVDIDYAKQVSILFSMWPKSKEWQKKYTKEIQSFIKLKSAKTELPWIKHLQSFKSFWKIMDMK